MALAAVASLWISLARGAGAQSAPAVKLVPTPAPTGIFTPIVNYTGEAAANPSGGIRQGTAFAGQVLFGVDVDMWRLAGARGGTLHFDVTNRHGNNLAVDDIGNDTSVQETYGGQRWQLATFSYEQKLASGRLDIEAGRIAANVSFLHSTLYCVFQTNSSCGNPPMIFRDSNLTGFPQATWGIHAKEFISERIYLHSGAYEVNPDRTRLTDDGFNFNTNHMTGVIVPAEFGYTTTFANDAHPRNYILGGWYDQSTYSDPLFDTSGRIAVISGAPSAQLRGRSGAYARFDQLLTRPNLASQRGLTLFGVGIANVSGRVSEDRYVEIGLVQMGTFPRRDADTFGFVINDQHYTNLALDSIRAARASVGASSDIPTHQTMTELAYGAQITPVLLVSPNLQYIIDPDQTAEPFRRSNISNTLVLGLKFTYNGSPLLQPRLAQH